jgi:propionyl-CoA synthetase
MIATMMGVEIFPIKPGSVGKAVCGYNIKYLMKKGIELGPNEEGYVVLQLPLPRIFIRSGKTTRDLKQVI